MSKLPLVLAALAAAAAAPAPAQQPEPAGVIVASEDRVEKAIAEYERWKQERGKDAQRNRSLLWLGEIDRPEVTEYLGKELRDAGDNALANIVLQAIGKVRRKELEDDMFAVAVRASAPVHVRRTAADAVAKLGDRGVDRLVELVLGGDAAAPRPVRDPIAMALLASGDDRAIRALVPLIGSQLASYDDLQKVNNLRLFDRVAGVYPVSAARIDLVKGSHIVLAAMAWRQLAVEGHDRAKALALDVVEKLPELVPAQAAADAIIGLSIVRDADFYPVIMRMAKVNAPEVRRALRDAAEYAAQDPALLHFLVTEGIENEHPDARTAARELLNKAPSEAVQPLLAKVRKALKRPKKESLDLAIGLHELLAKDPSWRGDLLAMAAAKEPEVRTVGLSLLFELGSDAAIEQAQDSIGAKLWPLRSAAYRYLGRFRSVGSIPLLINRVGKEDGRLADELAQALFRHTGTRCWSKKEWEAWWRERQSGFALPHADSVRTSTGSGGGTTSAYYDIPLVSTKIAFLVDHSGSMRAQIGTDKKFNRLEAAKRQLTQVLESLPASHMCNLIPYETQVRPIWKELRKLDGENRKDILKRVERLQPAGGTNIFDSLQIAFDDPEVDTIYLLTDGQPSAGRLTDPADILAEVRRWYRSRQIVVHCIALGLESPLLKEIAEITDGVYKSVR